MKMFVCRDGGFLPITHMRRIFKCATGVPCPGQVCNHCILWQVVWKWIPANTMTHTRVYWKTCSKAFWLTLILNCRHCLDRQPENYSTLALFFFVVGRFWYNLILHHIHEPIPWVRCISCLCIIYSTHHKQKTMFLHHAEASLHHAWYEVH